MNIKKLFATLAGVSLFAQTVIVAPSALAATYSQELQDAYNWAYGKGVTTMSSIDNANMYGAITRAEMAKMLSVYAMEVLGMTPDTSKACNFGDIDSVKGDLHDYIIKSCQLGLMGQGITSFRPYDTISRAEFGTALSRTLWGNKYEGGTPYYANHLNALKAAGIMNQIANAESTKEVRGYVMLMLMRSEGNDSAKVDCEDALIKLACATDSDDCPAACRDNGDEKDSDEVVKSGSLVVSSSAADDRSVVVASGSNAVSDLDTLTFKTSEEVTLSKVTLEKYGYSSASNLIANVWLENEDGKEISNKATPNTKGLVNLTLKKDYKVIDGTLNAIIVVETNSGAKVGGTVGFKVTDVNSTAKDVDLGNYKAYTYDVVAYDGTQAKVTAKGGTKDYNYEGKAVEISKFKVKAPDDSAIEVNSFTLTNSGSLDIYDNIDSADVEVSIDGKVVKANISINKDEEMTVSLKDSLEISAKAQVEVIITAKMNGDFEDYGETIQLKIAKASDLSANDKNNARITVDTSSAKWVIYQINGGEVKITNTKLGTIEASINSTDVLIAEGYITVGEDLEKGTIVVNIPASGGAIESMRLEIAGDEYDATPDNTRSNWTFSNVEVTESGKLRLYVDIYDNTGYENATLTPSITKFQFSYVNAGKNSKSPDISGTWTVSKLTLTPAEGSLKNNLSASDDVEFTNKETNTEVVFDGTYKADKQNIELNSFTISGTNSTNSRIKFYLYVDDMESSVASVTLNSGTTATLSDTFKDVLVKAGETVKVKVEAEVRAEETITSPATSVTIGKFLFSLDGEDENDNNAGHAHKYTSNMVIVEKGSVSVTDSGKATKVVLRKASSATIAEFTVKPDGANSVTLEEVEFSLNATGSYVGELKLTVGSSDKKLSNNTTLAGAHKAEFSTNVDSKGVVVTVELDSEFTGEVELVDLKVNGKEVKKTYKKRFEDAIVWFRDFTPGDAKTTIKFGVDKRDRDTVENVEIEYNGTYHKVNAGGEVEDGKTFTFENEAAKAYDITAIRYSINNAGTSSTTASCATPTPTMSASGSITTPVSSNPSSATDCEYIVTDYTAYSGTATPKCTAPTEANAVTGSKFDSPSGAADCQYTYTGATAFSTGTLFTPTYIEVRRDDYYDMFRKGMNEDGAEVYIAKAKN